MQEKKQNIGDLYLMCLDMNGLFRGKWVEQAFTAKALDNKIRLPLSTQGLDIWGDDNNDKTGLTLSCGDPDGVCVPDKRSLVPVPWVEGNCYQVLASMFDGNCQQPSEFDCRQLLVGQIQKFAKRGLKVVMAAELEFYFLDKQLALQKQAEPGFMSKKLTSLPQMQLYEINLLERYREVLAKVYAYAKVQNVEVNHAIAEISPGQFEVNLQHSADPLLAADMSVYLKRLIKAAAERCDLFASFMAKPMSEDSTSGMHVHLSLQDESGNNVFSQDSQRLFSAVGALLARTLEVQAVMAPHANSYRRFIPNSFAPYYLNWGYDHRAVAIRIPESEGAGARLEYRIAGADVNIHLVFAAILAAVYESLEQDFSVADPLPPPRKSHASEDTSLPHLSVNWHQAIERFASSEFTAQVFGHAYRDLYAQVKTIEADRYLAYVSDFDLDSYLLKL